MLLPDDVVCELFYALASIDPPICPRPKGEPRYKPHRPATLGWISLTHVCRHWRSVGIDLATLWGQIVCTFQPIDEIIQRTKSAPLTIEFSPSRRSYKSEWHDDVLSPLVPRARVFRDCLYVSRNGDEWGRWYTFFANRALPVLEELILSDGRNFYLPEREGEVLNAPRLRTLAIDIARPIYAPMLRSLHASFGLWHWKILLAYIRRFPLLEDFRADIIIGEDYKNVVLSPDLATLESMLRHVCEPSIVTLSHLKSLIITAENCCDVDGILALLSHLELPSTVALTVTGASEATFAASCLAHHSFCNLRRDVLSIIDTCHVGLGYRLRVSLCERDPSSSVGVHRRPQGCAQLTVYSAPRYIPDILDSIPPMAASTMRELSFSHAICLCTGPCLGSMANVDPRRLTTSLLRFSGITTLELRRQGSNQLVIRLLAATSPTSEIVFPELRTLVLEIHDGTDAAWWDGLRAMLAARKEAGRPIGRLVVQGDGASHTKDMRSTQLEETLDGDLEYLRITLEPERQLVDEVVDERDAWTCNCQVG
ncbi:hypothetical protein PENSPDRAFT_645202 [Peniophora sp. CONT]|nr:hypothetical protein PENSPDRAFT_645202 [Peniophora sp. CONT]